MGVVEPFEAWRPIVSVFIPYFDKDVRLVTERVRINLAGDRFRWF